VPKSLRPPAPWNVASVDEGAVASLVAGAGLDPVVARLLVLRGVSSVADARRFMSPDLARDWRDPESIPGMPACADAVAAAVRAGHSIVVFGDFDVDGLTAAALTCRGLALMGATVSAVVPHRFDEGYGLSEAAVERTLALAPDLVITVDCGIGSGREVALMRAAGVDVVVTDHHEPGEDVPVGVPVCDPKLTSSGFQGLAGAGVALKLIAATGARLGFPDVWKELTDLAAIGTVGDIVPLLDENRALVADGLARMRRGARPGIAALFSVAGVDAASVTSDRIAFAAAPRLNAAGRIADPAQALELLLADDPARAAEIASALDGYNTVRQAAEADLADEALRAAAAAWRDGTRVLVLAGEGWHEGVRGIVASRVVGRYGVPALVFSLEDGEARGSGRSVGDVDLHQALSTCSDLLIRFGGHAAAVGATMRASDLQALADRLQTALARLPEELFERRLTLDAEIPLSEATRELASGLDALEPFGQGNARPLLGSRGVFMNGASRVGKTGDHLKFEAYDGVLGVPAIAFRCPEAADLITRRTAVDLAYSLEADEWRGRMRVQLVVRSIVPHAASGDAPAAELVEELFADAARILARGEYEGIADADSFHTKLAGVSFEGRQDVVARLEPGIPLRLVRQPDNEYDPNALAVMTPAGDQVGFLNRRLAAVLAPAIDAGAQWEVSVTDVTGTDEAGSRGVNVLLERPGLADEAEADAERLAARRAELAGLEPEEREAEVTRALIGDRTPHDAQREALAHLAAGRSCLAVMATGRGKSFIFQSHAARIALVRGEASVFVYPLRALVADQAFHLTDAFAELGLTVRLITGETSPTARDELFAALADGAADVLLTTPEFLERHAARFAASGRVRFVVVDEAHHVGLSRAGHRPAYARLDEALATLGNPVVCAVTATASTEVAQVVRETLGIDSLVLDATQRTNLRVADRRGMSDKVGHLAAIAARGEKVIVYVNSRDESVKIAMGLRDASPHLTQRTAFYNGGLSRSARHAVESAFRAGEITAIVATSAFGEGVDIPDVRHVALYHLPFNRVEFNQMCGRAGRDGEAATVHLLFGQRDGRVNELVLQSSAPDLDDLRALYAALRERASAAAGEAGGWVEATNAELAADVKKRRSKARMTDRGVSTGVGIFREVGLVTGEGAGAYRRLALQAVEGKVDLTASVRYSEGIEETEEFSEFRTWVLDAGAEELLAAFDRPILPTM
jgi:single-stranded-DNA-specific exonuclease